MKNWIAEQYTANLFEGCSTRDEVASVINDLAFLEFNKDWLITEAWNYIKERLKVYKVETRARATAHRTYKIFAANEEAAARIATGGNGYNEICQTDEYFSIDSKWEETADSIKPWEIKGELK